MEQLPLFDQARAPWSVGEISQYIRELIESHGALQNVWVQGEVSNFSRPKSGHWYFTLKDAMAQLPCVMWRSAAELQLTVPEDGESVQVHGGLSVYEAGGRYQLYVTRSDPREKARSTRISCASKPGWRPKGCLRPSASVRCQPCQCASASLPRRWGLLCATS